MTRSATGIHPAAQLHPAALWAIRAGFTPEQVDCSTAVVLKILDNKCKRLPGEKLAVMAFYDVVRHLAAALFDRTVHDASRAMRLQPGTQTLDTIHPLWVHAEAAIPRPVMKHYKAFLREGLFGYPDGSPRFQPRQASCTFLLSCVATPLKLNPIRKLRSNALSIYSIPSRSSR